MRTLIIMLAMLLVGPRGAVAGDANAPAAGGLRATDCQAAMDQIDDMVSAPVTEVATDAMAARLAEGLALCRTGHSAEGARLMRHTLRALRPPDTARGYWMSH